MKNLLFLVIGLFIWGCSPKSKIIKSIGKTDYEKVMALSSWDFDQTADGFRKYSGDYELVQLLIPEYIRVNNLSAKKSRNLHWHLGQIHAFNNNYTAAIIEMKQAYEGGGISWKCYVDGSIAFLEQNKGALIKALETLSEQENINNIEILEKFVKHFDKSYAEAYSADWEELTDEDYSG